MQIKKCKVEPNISVGYKSQQGAALLIFILIILLSSTYTLVVKLNTNNNYYIRQSKETQQSLQLAKQALISYAINFPEIDASSGTDPINGPGYLPCPDINSNGSAGGTCSLAGNTTIGRLPYRTLEVPEIRDSSGAHLWYALSDNFRNSAGLEPLNSETPGQLTLDGTTDIVAVIIAPGEPIGTQSRDSSETNHLSEIANYLELENSDFDGGGNLDGDFTVTDPDLTNFTDFNDRVMTITRQELMEAVEKRVLGEIDIALTNLKTNTPVTAYPWLTPFADPKTTQKRITGEHSGSNNQANLTDSSADFSEWGVAIGDAVWNITDGSYGIVTAVSATSLTIGGGLSLGTDNDFDTDDEYFVDISSFPTLFVGTSTATVGSSGLVLEDTTKDFDDLGIRIGDIIDNITDGGSGVIESIDNDELTVSSLTTGAFNFGDVYRIRTSMGRATADTDSNTLTLEDTRVDFTTMGIQAGDVIRNITDGSYGRITTVAANQLTVTELLFGTNNTFSVNDYYSIPRLNSPVNTREGLLALHETGEHYRTDIDFTWDFTANAADIVVNDSTILQNYINNYIDVGSKSFDDTVGTCTWLAINIADCFGYFKDFVNISGNDDSSSNSTSIRDSSATFSTDGVKRGDIAMNYDDETLQVSGTVDAGNSGTATTNTDANGLTLEDTNNNFNDIRIAVGDTIYNTTDGSSGTVTAFSTNQITVTSLSGGTNNTFTSGDDYQVGDVPILYDASATFSSYERYSYLVQNQTLESDLGESKIQGVIVDTFGDDTLEAEAYVGEGTEPIQFRPGDVYRIYKPRKFVIETINSETQVTTDNYESGTNPDFDSGERYRIMPAANMQSSNLDFGFTSGGIDYLIDFDADFINDGVEVGDIVENHNGAFGEITSLSAVVISTILYGGSSQSFLSGNSYTVYYDYVYSREHTLHARFTGNSNTKVVSEERKRDVCLGYNADCTSTATAVNFAGNGGVPFVSVTDFQEDETTEVGTATFTPTSLSSGSLLVSNIDLDIYEAENLFPSWFFNNDWHKLIYLAYSAGDVPNGGTCTAGTDCLVLNGAGTPNNDKNAIVVTAGMAVNKTLDNACAAIAETAQDRTSGTINDYYESDNCDSGDDSFQKQTIINTFNDQVRIIEP